ncbi:MAG: FAD-dependent oxidoreductase [Polyangiaceae bacterium]|nr:FAD-dependent oxidoreductase [Polyangiaceae bacterium]
MAKRVLILGGGVGGLSAAHELVERGFEVEVFESRRAFGGKARSIPVPGSGTEGRPNLPGEHGFRFFPGFYKHLPDTMKRIPFGDNSHGVYTNLVQATEYLMAERPDKNLTFLVRFPESIAEWREAFTTYFNAQKLGIPKDELAYFVEMLMVILTSCKERRLAEYENIPWWDFISAAKMSKNYQTYLARGLTRSLVAMRAEVASTRTVGDIFLQLLLDVYAPGIDFDRVLNGPTTERWIEPWIGYLTERGVELHRRTMVKAIRVISGQIAYITVRDPDGTLRDVAADYYVSALPVEQMRKLLNADLLAADPNLAKLSRLKVAWMNGLQVYLKNDHSFANGHINFVTTPWALTAVSQQQFFVKPFTEYGNGDVRGCLSIDISDWETPGILYGKAARDLDSAEKIANEVIAQMRAALAPSAAAALADENIERWFLDPDIVIGTPTRNQEPLLINTAGSWKNRPEAATALPNFFLAADYVRTYTDLATMEAANEAARRAVNSILARSGSRAEPCHLWKLQEPLVFAPMREYDKLRFELGLPNALAPHVHPPEAPATGSTPLVPESEYEPGEPGAGTTPTEPPSPQVIMAVHEVEDLPYDEPHEGD